MPADALRGGGSFVRSLCWICLVLFAAGVCLLQAQDAGVLLQEGMARLHAEDYRGAADRFEQSYNWQPGFEAAFRAGYSHFNLRHFAEAELWLGKALAVNPASEDATVYLASAIIGQYQAGKAAAILEEFVTLHPEARRAAATLAALKADLKPRRAVPRSLSLSQVAFGSMLLLSVMAYMISLRAGHEGIREMGRGAGLLALTSMYLLSPFFPPLGAGGAGWAAYKLRSGFQLYRYERRHGRWARRVGAILYLPVAAFIRARGHWDEGRVGVALRGLVRAGIDKESVRRVESQLLLAPTGGESLDQALSQLAEAPRLIRESVLRLLVVVAAALGGGPAETSLLKRFAAALRLAHRVPAIIEEGAATDSRPTPGSSAGANGTTPAGGGESRPPIPDPLEGSFRALGLSTSASRREVKSGYRRQVRQHHPDRAAYSSDRPPAQAGEFRRIREAYESICKARGWQP